jgi:hydroxyacylglutathione hydrolase
MKLIALPAFSDNYIWVLHNDQEAVVVDPGDSAPVLTYLEAQRIRLQSILVTHHHADHTGGVAQLQDCTGAKVYAPLLEPVSVPHMPVQEGDHIECLGGSWQVLDVPGHTAGHVAYWVQAPDHAPILFCGDTLFSGGCGRLFEGTPAQMWDSLSKLGRLPSNTQLCCAHEYTLSNLRFAQAVEPDNPDLQQHMEQCLALRQSHLPTLPSTIGLELRINPFLRVQQPTVQASARMIGPDTSSDVAVFAALREWKNRFS